MSELKPLPCPFCGNMPEVIEDGYKAIAVHCFNCGADITAETARKATAAWNRRAQPDNEPLTCDGCLYSEDYYDPVPCHGCSRVGNTNDCYRRKPEPEGGDR